MACTITRIQHPVRHQPTARRAPQAALALGLATFGLLAGGAAAAAAPALPAPDMQLVVNIGSNQNAQASPGVAAISTTFSSGKSELRLGDLPFVSAAMDERGTQSGLHGGSVYTRLLYEVMFYNPAGGNLPKLDVTVSAFDALIARGDGLSFSARSTSQLSIWGTGAATGFSLDRYNCTALTNSSQGCAPGTDAAITPFTIQMAQNTVYNVLMRVDTQAIANFDPTLSANAHGYAQLTSHFDLAQASPAGGYFVYSAGITSAVPEPQTWGLLLAGLAVLGAKGRARRSKWNAFGRG